MDAQSGWRSPRAQRDAALELGLVAGGGGAMTDGRTSRLHWIYEVAYHAGYVHTSEDHELIHRAAELSGGAVRTDAQIITDWYRVLGALFAHGVEHALPPGADPAPLDFDGIGWRSSGSQDAASERLHPRLRSAAVMALSTAARGGSRRAWTYRPVGP